MATFFKRIRHRMIAPIQLFYWRVAVPQEEGAKVLIEHDGKYLLIRENFGAKHWTLPGGRNKPGEDALATAKRKAKEEAGITLSELVPLGSYFHTRQQKRDVICAYFARVDSPFYKVDNNTVTEAGWFTAEEIHGMSISPSVEDVLELYTKYRSEK